MAAAVLGVGQSVGGRFPQRRNTERDREKSLFAGVSIGFCPRTGVGLVLFSGTQSINELPLLRAIAFQELVQVYGEAREKSCVTPCQSLLIIVQITEPGSKCVCVCYGVVL